MGSDVEYASTTKVKADREYEESMSDVEHAGESSSGQVRKKQDANKPLLSKLAASAAGFSQGVVSHARGINIKNHPVFSVRASSPDLLNVSAPSGRVKHTSPFGDDGFGSPNPFSDASPFGGGQARHHRVKRHKKGHKRVKIRYIRRRSVPTDMGLF